MTVKSGNRFGKRIRDVLAHIERHLDEKLSLAELSALAHSSPFHFHRRFAAATGTGVGALVRLLRLRRASIELVFERHASIAEIAGRAGFANAESFSRAFKKHVGQTPRAFRKRPRWRRWQVRTSLDGGQEPTNVQVEIVDFPTTRVAALEHRGPERLVYVTTAKFVEWRQANGVHPRKGLTYGIHYADPEVTNAEDYRLDLCVSVDGAVAANPQGVVEKVIPGGRCARARHVGSRHDVTAAAWLYRQWLPTSGERLRDFPMFFHYVNVGPGVKEHEMITDVYLPIA